MIDVVIVGGSLAGAATAIHLAEAGHSVVLLERSSGVRRKACGEGLFPRGVAELDALGLLDAVRPLGAPLEGVRFHAGPYSALARFGSDDHSGLGIERSDLDPLIRERARAVGADVRLGITVRSLIMERGRFAGVTTDSGDEIRARVVVGADGLRSRLRQQARLDRPAHWARYGVSAHALLPDRPAPFVEIHFGDGLEIYVTPVGGRTANVAMLLRRSAMRRFAGHLDEAFQSVLRDHPRVLPGADIVDAPVAAGPFPARSARAWRANLVLVGDAAGFFDAISGEGMSTTLVSARACATAIDAYLDAGDSAAFEGYDRARRSLVRNSDLLAGLSLVLSSRPALARHAVRNLMRRPETFERLASVSAGEMGLLSLRARDALALLVGV